MTERLTSAGRIPVRGGGLLRRARRLPPLVAIQLVLIVGTGVAAVAVLPVWAFADERSHAAFIDVVGEGRFPVDGEEMLPRDLAFHCRGGCPEGVADTPVTGWSGELFQPPLY